MPFALFASNPSCFYCGARSNQRGRVRQFQCQSCEAVNYLDENGQITDPPAQSTHLPSASVRYAHATARPDSPSSAPEDIFCRTCLKNQHMLRETLASYLPPEDDPQYDHYLASYDSYREKLEQRFPQICPQCAPRARDRIKKSAYVAKTDHLRRMMEQTRHDGVGVTPGQLLMSMVIRLGGLGWVLSAAGQICWHGLAAHSVSASGSENIMEESLEPIDAGTNLGRICLQRSVQSRQLDPACVMVFSDVMPLLLLTGLLTVWWNNQLCTKYLTSGGRMTRLGEYYTLQATILCIRLAAWHLCNASNPWLTGETLKGAHLFMALLIATVYLISTRTVKLDQKSPVSFYLSDGSVLPNVAAAQQVSNTSNSTHHEQSREPFPIHKLASPTTPSITRQTSQQFSAAQFDNVHDDPDEMDWTPASRKPSNSFNPPSCTTTAQISASFNGPCPFRGSLPPAPIAPAHRLRKPASALPGAFRKASETQKHNFSAGISSAAAMPKRPFPGQHGLVYDNGYDDDTTAADTGAEFGRLNLVDRRRTDIQMAAPKFWAAGDVDRKTGLEDIFEESFSIKDIPTGVANHANSSSFSAARRDRSGGGSASIARHGERWGGFGERMGVRSVPDGQDHVEEISEVVGGSYGSGVFVVLVPIVILGISTAIVKGGWI